MRASHSQYDDMFGSKLTRRTQLCPSLVEKTNFEPKSSNVNFSTIGLVYIPLRGKHSLNPTVLRGLISLIYAFAYKIWLTLYGSLKLKENEPVNQNTMIF